MAKGFPKALLRSWKPGVAIRWMWESIKPGLRYFPVRSMTLTSGFWASVFEVKGGGMVDAGVSGERIDFIFPEEMWMEWFLRMVPSFVFIMFAFVRR